MRKPGFIAVDDGATQQRRFVRTDAEIVYFRPRRATVKPSSRPYDRFRGTHGFDQHASGSPWAARQCRETLAPSAATSTRPGTGRIRSDRAGHVLPAADRCRLRPTVLLDDRDVERFAREAAAYAAGDPTDSLNLINSYATREANVQRQAGEGTLVITTTCQNSAGTTIACSTAAGRVGRGQRRHRQRGPTVHLPHAIHQLVLRWFASGERLIVGSRPRSRREWRGDRASARVRSRPSHPSPPQWPC